MARRVRPPAVAGTFYPASRHGLAEALDRLLAAGGPGDGPGSGSTPDRPPAAVLVPHAGYVYSGPVAATAYRTLMAFRDRIRTVLLLGPAHRARLGGLALPAADGFATPLGSMPVDAALAGQVGRLPAVHVDAAAHEGEHSLEVQVPFLQRVVPHAAIVPIAVGAADPEDVARVVDAALARPATLVVVSSDLSHYLPYEAARRADGATVQRILDLAVPIGHDDACGATAVNGLLLAARRSRLEPRLLDLRNSGDTAGPRDEVVGYAAIAFLRPRQLGAGQRDEP